MKSAYLYKNVVFLLFLLLEKYFDDSELTDIFRKFDRTLRDERNRIVSPAETFNSSGLNFLRENKSDRTV